MRLCQVVSELELYCIFQVEGEDRALRLCGDCSQVGSNQEGSQQDYRMNLETLLVRSDSSRFSRKADRDNTMVIEDHRYAGRKNSELWSQKDIDEELADIKK